MPPFVPAMHHTLATPHLITYWLCIISYATKVARSIGATDTGTTLYVMTPLMLKLYKDMLFNLNSALSTSYNSSVKDLHPIMSSSPDRTTGQYHSIKGTAVETIGNLTGSQDWQHSGRQEHDSGEG
jgi:hypothetical protein